MRVLSVHCYVVVVILWVGLDSNFSVRCSALYSIRICLQQELYVSNQIECGFMDVCLPYIQQSRLGFVPSS